MSISTNYNDYYRYSQYTQALSTQGQLVNQSNSGQTSDVDELMLQMADKASASNNTSKSPLESLIADGTITSKQEKAIKDAFEAARMVHQTQSGAANATSQFKNPLESLVTAGTITEDQASAVKSTLDSSKNVQRMAPPPPQSEEEEEDSIESILESLVSDGTITSDQKESIISTLQSVFESSQTQTDKQSSQQADSLDERVGSGTITDIAQSAAKLAFESAIKAYQQQQESYEDTYLLNS